MIDCQYFALASLVKRLDIVGADKAGRSGHDDHYCVVPKSSSYDTVDEPNLPPQCRPLDWLRAPLRVRKRPPPTWWPALRSRCRPPADVENLARLCGDRPRAIIGVKRHSLFAARKQQRFQSQILSEFLSARFQIGFALPSPNHFTQLGTVRRQDGCAGIAQ